MLFNSPEFIVFFVLFYFLYLLLPFRAQNLTLLIASYIFYGWWDTRFLFLVALSTTVDFWVGLMLENGQLSRRQQVLPAAYLAISALVFLGLKPDTLWTQHFSNAAVRPDPPVSIGWAAAGIAGFLAILYVIYSILRDSKNPNWRLWCLIVSLVPSLAC